jgi:hypothetical protein
MRIIRTVASEAFLRRGFEIGQAPHIYMTQGAFHFPMTTSQPEGIDIMIKTFPEHIYPVMTGQTIRAKR